MNDDYGPSRGRMTFLRPLNDAAIPQGSHPVRAEAERGDTMEGRALASVPSAHSHTIRSALGARVLRGQRCLCGAIYEEIVGYLEVPE